MTTAEKIAMVQVLVENDPTATNEVLAVYLALAKDAIFNRMYPFGVPASVTDIPSQYEVLQCKITMRYFLRRGAEGEKSHNENGPRQARFRKTKAPPPYTYKFFHP